MKKYLLIGCICVFITLLSACGKEVKGAYNLDIKPFSFTNQENKTFGSDDLKGKVWIADFIFTNCTTVCSPMTYNMTKLNKMAKAENLDVEFVSFSVDPEVDTPDILKNFAQTYESITDNWNLLTGYNQTEIESFALKNFKAYAMKPEGQDQAVHSKMLYLLVGNKLIKDYEGVSDVPFKEIINDIKIVSK